MARRSSSAISSPPDRIARKRRPESALRTFKMSTDTIDIISFCVHFERLTNARPPVRLHVPKTAHCPCARSTVRPTAITRGLLLNRGESWTGYQAGFRLAGQPMAWCACRNRVAGYQTQGTDSHPQRQAHSADLGQNPSESRNRRLAWSAIPGASATCQNRPQKLAYRATISMVAGPNRLVAEGRACRIGPSQHFREKQL